MKSNPSRLIYRIGVGLVAVLAAGVSMTWAPWAQAAGNVQVSVENGILRIRGDNESNCILVGGGGNIGDYGVHGCDLTLINGGPGVEVSGVNDDISIKTFGGDDEVTVHNGDNDTAPDDLEISTGTGNDTVEVSRFAVLDDMVISTSSGNDLVIIDEVAVHDSTQISTGSGTDCTVFDDALAPATATDCPISP